MDTKDRKRIDIKQCARCGQDHLHLRFKKFQDNPIADSDGTIWNYWGICPETKEPILMKITET